MLLHNVANPRKITVFLYYIVFDFAFLGDLVKSIFLELFQFDL